MQPGDLIGVIRRRFWVVVVTVFLCVGLAVGYNSQQIPVYQASITILVGQDQGLMEDPAQAASLRDITATLSEAVATRPVAQRVVRSLNLDVSPEAIAAGTSAEVVPETQFITVTYADTDPSRAQQIVNAVGDAFSEQVSEVSPRASAISATVWERATVPQSPVSPNLMRTGLVALVLGSMLGTALALLLEYLDDSWQSSEELERAFGIPTLGTIPTFMISDEKKG